MSSELFEIAEQIKAAYAKLDNLEQSLGTELADIKSALVNAGNILEAALRKEQTEAGPAEVLKPAEEAKPVTVPQPAPIRIVEPEPEPAAEPEPAPMAELAPEPKPVFAAASAPEPEPETIVCSICGKPNNAASKFCIYCGSKIVVPEKPESAPTPTRNKFCINCGAKLEEGFAFCMECGTRIE